MWLLWLYSTTPIILSQVSDFSDGRPSANTVINAVYWLAVVPLIWCLLVLYEVVPGPRWELPVWIVAITGIDAHLVIQLVSPTPFFEPPGVEATILWYGAFALSAFVITSMAVRITGVARQLSRSRAREVGALARTIRSVRSRALQAERLSIIVIGVMLSLVIAGAGVSVGIALVEQRHREAFFEDGTSAFSHFEIVADTLDGGVEALRRRHAALLKDLSEALEDTKNEQPSRPDAFAKLRSAVAQASRPQVDTMSFDELWEAHRELVNAVQLEISPVRSDLEKKLAYVLEIDGKVSRAQLLPGVQALHRAALDARESLAAYQAAASHEQLPWAEVVSRITIAALTLFLVQIFFNMYRYAKRRADWLVERVEALEMLTIPTAASGQAGAPPQVIAAYARALERAAPEFATAPMPAIDQLVRALRSAVGAVKPEAAKALEDVAGLTETEARPPEEK